MSKLTHFDDEGNAIMVDVGDKEPTVRIASASGLIKVSKEIVEKIENHHMKKGDVLGVAQIAGIMGLKKTSDLIPLCHTLLIDKSSIDFEIIHPKTSEEDYYIKAFCTVKTTGKTGVEMEALTGVSVALLTVYDMCKAIDKSMVISDIQLESKQGGKSGDYQRQ